MRVASWLRRLLPLFSVVILLTSILVAVPAVFFPPTAEAAISLRSSTTNSSTPCTSGLTINKPSGVIVGDVMIAQIASDTGSISTPSGWALIDSAGYHSNSMHMATFFRIIEGVEGSSFSFAIGSSTACFGGIIAFEGVDNGQVIDNSGLVRTTNSGTSTTVSAPSITTVSANTVLVVSMFKATGAGSANFSTVSGMTEQYDFGSANGAAGADYATQASAGASGIKTSTISSGNWAVHMVALKPATVHMMLFWDGGGSAPAGWSFVTGAEGYYLRGDSPADYGTTGGQSTHVHDNPNSLTVGAPSLLINAPIGLNNSSAPTAHTHTVGATTVGSASNEPDSYQIRLIRFNSGVPNIIPAGSIALFDGDPGVPTDGHWAQVVATQGQVVKIGSTVNDVATRTDTHTHTITWGAIGNGVGAGVNTCILFCASATASPAHSHATPSPSASAASTSAIPPYFQPMLAKVDQATPTLSLGLTAMFDGEPGGGWIVKSDTGGDYNNRFIRPNTTFGVPTNPANLCDPGFGCVGHQITTATTTIPASSGSPGNGNAGTGAAATAHTHPLTAGWPAYTSDSHYTGNNEYFLPPYFNIVVAEKVNFILSGYRWYDDNNLEAVTSPWSPLDIALNTAIPSLPAAYAPPYLGTELRLRVQIEVNNNDLAIGEIQFKLQYKENSDGNCTTGVWTDLDSSAGGGIWRYATSGVTDGTQLSTSVLSSVRRQRYAKSSSPGTNTQAVAAGETMEWDFHFEHNGAPGGTLYSFRLAEDSGILLSEYAFCPTLAVKPETSNQLRHGNFFEGGAERGFSWVD